MCYINDHNNDDNLAITIALLFLRHTGKLIILLSGLMLMFLIANDSKPYFFTLYCILLKLPILVGLLSAIQLPFNINFPWFYIWKLKCLGLPEETISLPVLCAAKIQCPGIPACTETTLSGYQFTPWLSLGDLNFLWPEKFILGQSRNLTRDLLICSWMRYHWINMPPYYQNEQFYKTIQEDYDQP